MRSLKTILLIMVVLCLVSCGTGYLDVAITLVPANDPGRFDVSVDNAIMPGGANLTNGSHTGATPYAAGTHTITETAHPGTATNMADYTVSFSGACTGTGATTATVNLTANNSLECSITNTRNTTAGTPPPPPTFTPTSGTGACPYTVALADSDPSAKIFFTTDTTQPTQSSTPFTGPISVSASQTISAIAANASGVSSVAAQNYTCGMFTSVVLTIQTGDDDARTDSAIQATLGTNSGSTMWCLKYSDNGSFQSCSQQHPGITWGNFSTNSSTQQLSAPVAVEGFNSLVIQLAEFPGFGKSDDNWDLQSFTLTGNVTGASPGFPTSATLLTVSGATPPGSGTCFARFKHPGGEQVSTVTFNFVGGPVTVMDDNGPHTAPYCPD